jgi:hypothetical protein
MVRNEVEVVQTREQDRRAPSQKHFRPQNEDSAGRLTNDANPRSRCPEDTDNRGYPSAMWVVLRCSASRLMARLLLVAPGRVLRVPLWADRVRSLAVSRDVLPRPCGRIIAERRCGRPSRG